MSTLLRTAAIALLLVLLVSACAEDTADEPAEPETAADDTADEAAEETADEEGPEEAADEADPSGDVEVATATSDLGEILVDGEGMTLYMFEPDEAGPSTCYDECADNWPPLTAEDAATAGDGADEDLLGTTERDDGSVQVTYDGWPLYYWVGDEAVGDTNGQGVNEVWWVLAPDATPVENAAAGAGDDEEEERGGAGY